MRKFCKTIFLLVVGLLLLSGCSEKVPSTPMPLVTGVRVTCRLDGEFFQWHYTDPDKMDAVLHYLLRLKPYGVAEQDPEQVIGDTYKIDVLLSNGDAHTYRQRADRYISKDCHIWKLIDPKRAAQLYPLLQQLESDLP